MQILFEPWKMQICDIYRCIKRHLKTCKYYLNHGRCTFNPCAFLHKDIDNDFVSLEKENLEIVRKFKKIDKDLKELEKNARLSKNIIDKLTKVEEKFDHITDIEKQLNEKDTVIKALVEKVNELEKRIEKQKQINFIPEKSKETISCSYCDFTSLSEQGLKVHIKRKHTLTACETFPKECDICDDLIENKNKLKIHMKLHSYKKAAYKCEDCEFIGESPYTMDVHSGKLYSENKELFVMILLRTRMN